METNERKVILIIADIRGYTRFVVSNRTSLTHSQVIITELTKAIIRQVEMPLEVSKLEGDTVFLYAIKQEGESSWIDVKKKIGAKLIKFFEAFSEKVVELAESNICLCHACRNIDKLKLKIVAHSGEALFYRTDKFFTLSGVDVITVHRLLKNSVEGDQYILMTEPAYRNLEFPDQIMVARGQENYDELGTIQTLVYLPPFGKQYREEIRDSHNYSSAFIKIKNVLLKMFKSMLFKRGLFKVPHFRNLPGDTS